MQSKHVLGFRIELVCNILHFSGQTLFLIESSMWFRKVLEYLLVFDMEWFSINGAYHIFMKLLKLYMLLFIHIVEYFLWIYYHLPYCFYSNSWENSLMLFCVAKFLSRSTSSEFQMFVEITWMYRRKRMRTKNLWKKRRYLVSMCC